MRTVELQGGPLDGKRHTIQDPIGDGREPALIGRWEDGNERQTEPTVGRAWYKRDAAGVYRYERTVSA